MAKTKKSAKSSNKSAKQAKKSSRGTGKRKSRIQSIDEGNSADRPIGTA